MIRVNNHISRKKGILYGLVSIAEGLVLVLSLGKLDPDWRIKLAFSKWWDTHH
tara:strand:+ start:13862 stop:14020 length:159 start_codon:yes stop_codon:yes gene_type:complete